MKKFRYSKDTIRNQKWECQLIYNGETITLWEQHSRTDYFKIIKEVSKSINSFKAEEYKVKNKKYLIEIYED